MSCHCCKTKAVFCHKTPCKCKEFTLEVLDDFDLGEGTATILVKCNGEPLKNTKLGISTAIIPYQGGELVVLEKKCRCFCTDEEGVAHVTYTPGPQNQVRLSVNIQLGQAVKCSEPCCVRLTALLLPPYHTGVSPLTHLALDDDWEELKLFAAIDLSNRVIIDACTVPGQQGGPCLGARAQAIAQIAVADAFNSIENRFTRYSATMPNFPGGHVHAAIAQATRDALVALYSAQTATFDAYLATQLAAIPAGTAKTIGIAAGKKAAELILAARAGDGASTSNGTWVDPGPPYAQGVWRPAPPESNIGGNLELGKTYGSVPSFSGFSDAYMIGNFRAPPTPALTSAAYVADFEFVKSLGGDGTTTYTAREPDQTFIGVFFANDGTPGVGIPHRFYNQIAKHVATEQKMDPVEFLRMLALLTTAMADSAKVCWDTKWFYNFWRPIHAVRENTPGAVVPDPSWLCLGAPASNLPATQVNFTPPFCSRVSGHSAFGGTLFKLLQTLLGSDEIPFTVVSPEWNGVTKDNQGNVRPFRPRSFARLSQAEEENGMSRIYLGIHWSKLDCTDGTIQGRKVCDYVVANLFTPIV